LPTCFFPSPRFLHSFPFPVTRLFKSPPGTLDYRTLFTSPLSTRKTSLFFLRFFPPPTGIEILVFFSPPKDRRRPNFFFLRNVAVSFFFLGAPLIVPGNCIQVLIEPFPNRAVHRYKLLGSRHFAPPSGFPPLRYPFCVGILVFSIIYVFPELPTFMHLKAPPPGFVPFLPSFS